MEDSFRKAMEQTREMLEGRQIRVELVAELTFKIVNLMEENGLSTAEQVMIIDSIEKLHIMNMVNHILNKRED